MISIIIPCYNIGWTIGRCLESILLQTYEDYEIIIVDYGSTDDTKQVIDKVMSGTLQRYHYHCMQNYGKPAALRYGITQASGDYLFFINGHDFLNQNILQFLHHGLVASKVDFIICDYKDAGYHSRQMNVYRTPVDVYVNKHTPDAYITKTCQSNVHSDLRFNRIWGKLFKKELFSGLKFTDDAGAEITLMHNLTLKSTLIGVISNVLYFRTTPPNVVVDMSIAQAYKERTQYIEQHVKKYGTATLNHMCFQYIMALMEVFRCNTDKEIKTDCVRIINDVLQKHPNCLIDDKVSIYVKKITKAYLTN